MKRIILAASATLVVVVPGVASAQTLSHSQAVAYGRAYAHVTHKLGIRTAGCKLIGPHATCQGRVSATRILTSTDVLHRMLAPLPVVHYAPTAYHTTYSASSTSASSTSSTSNAVPASGGGGGYSIPSYIVQCESGGNWQAVNPGSGAGGAYQIMPQTWHDYGGSGLPQNASPAEQSAIAAKIYADVGASAWTCG